MAYNPTCEELKERAKDLKKEAVERKRRGGVAGERSPAASRLRPIHHICAGTQKRNRRSQAGGGTSAEKRGRIGDQDKKS